MHKPASEEAVTSLHDLSAVDLIEGFKASQFSPSEVLEDVLAHVAAWEPHIKALYAFDPDGARAVAKASTERWQKSEPMGPLDGVPVTIKDNIATKGVPVPLGAASMKLVPAERDAPPAARLREAGAVIFSKTTMPDYGMLSSGLSSFHPLTRNPWDLSKNPGGSSSGAGAAAAAGYGPLHLGTDIGGSVRLPACWCGLVALKPSLGRIPVDPPYVGRVAGPMTRTVDDAALMMSVLSRPDRARRHEPAAATTSTGRRWKNRRAKLRIGLMLDAGAGQPLEEDVREIAVKAAKAFEAAGAVVTESRRRDDARDARRARSFLARADVGRSVEADAGRARQGAALYPAIGRKPARSCRGVDVVRGFNATMAIRAAAAKLFCDLDYVISPVSPVVNFAAELAAPLNDPDQTVRAHRLYRAVEHGGKSGRLDQWRLRQDRAFRSACRSSAAASTTSACSAWPRRSRACAGRRSRGRARRRSSLRRHSGASRSDEPGISSDQYRMEMPGLRLRRIPE